MTAQVVTGFFTHTDNRLAVAKQEYELAKAHFREVAMNRAIGIPGQERRFRDALDRKKAARDRYVELLANRE